MSDLPICDDTGEDVDDCHCLDVVTYDEVEEADARYHAEREERD